MASKTAAKSTQGNAIISKTCTKTGETFRGTLAELAEFFYRDKSQRDGLSSWCKDAERAYSKAYTAGLKKAKATKKAAITDAKGEKAFEAAMKPERVERKRKPKVTGTKMETRTPQAKAKTTARRKARVTTRKEAAA